MIKKQFEFKVSEDVFPEERDECYADIIYEAKESEVHEDCYIVSWINPETEIVGSIEYHKDAVEHFVTEGSWIEIEKENSGGGLDVEKTV